LQDVNELSSPQTSVMEKNILVEQTKTDVSENNENNCSASKDQPNSYDTSFNDVPRQ